MVLMMPKKKRGWTNLYGKPKVAGVPKVAADEMFANTPEGTQAYLKTRRYLVDKLNHIRAQLGQSK